MLRAPIPAFCILLVLASPSCSIVARRVGKNICTISEEALRHPQPPKGALEVVRAPKKQDWERALGGEEAARPYVRARLAALPERLLVPERSLPRADADFAWRVAKDTWSGLSALTDSENGLPVDNVRFSSASPGADARVGDYTSGSDIGLHLISIVAAHDLGFISRDAASAEVRRILGTLEQLETYRGFFFNFYDTTSLERTSNFISFVDSSWLTAGLMVVRTSFPELYEPCTKLIAQTDYGFFYDRWTRRISHGYYIKPGERSPFDYGMLYTEARLGTLIAIGKGDIPEAAWFEMLRTFPAACRWQPETPQGVRVKTVRAHEVSAGYFEGSGVRYVPSWGGSMFEALMPPLLLDEMRYAPKSLGVNDRAHALVQQRYAAEVLGYPVWGISSSATPVGDGYSEYGVRVLGSRGYEAGAVAPYAAALALSVTPETAMANLRALADHYGIYGEYGFYDAVEPRSGTVAYKYLALDQSMLFIALANYLDGGNVQKRFASDPIIQRALPIIADEDFFD
jgi:hypothetical protein